MDKYRNNINNIDNCIFNLLLMRYNNVKEIGIIKNKENLPILDVKREDYINDKIDNIDCSFDEKTYIKNIYKSIMQNSKFIQNHK